MGENKLEVKDEVTSPIEGAEEADKVPDLDIITPKDRNTPFSVARFKVWRKSLMANLNGVLQAFQRDVVTTQVRMNLSWNAMNAVIRALVKKGLITEKDLTDAGAELMREAHENIQKAKAAAEAGGKNVIVPVTKVPIEEFRDSVNRELAKDK